MRARSFDFNNKVELLLGTWIKISKVDTGATEFDGSDMGPRQAFLNYQDRESELDQLQLIGTLDNNDGIIMESLTSVEFGMSQMETTLEIKNGLIN